MKRLLLVILCMLLALCACDLQKPEQSDDLLFYYYCPSENQAQDVTGAEVRSAPPGGDDLQQIINSYLQGPEKPTLQQLLPGGTALLELAQTPDTLTVMLSHHCAELSRLELSIAFGCFAKTLFPLLQGQTIVFKAENGFSNIDGDLIYREDTVLTLDTSAK